MKKKIKKTVASHAAAVKKAAPQTATTSAPPVTPAKKLPPAVAALLEPGKAGAADAPIGRTALASSGNLGGILLLAGLALGALLITLAMVIPAGATRFAFPEAVIEHHVDLAILGIALAALTGLVYALESAGK